MSPEATGPPATRWGQVDSSRGAKIQRRAKYTAVDWFFSMTQQHPGAAVLIAVGGLVLVLLPPVAQRLQGRRRRRRPKR
jgi:hypothetical protein